MDAAHGYGSIVVIIPALDEERAIGRVLGAIPTGLVDEIVVVDNRSTDATATLARAAGATVLHEPQRGYGAACLTGVRYALDRGYAIIVFLDADYSDHPEEMTRLVQEVTQRRMDFVVGSRSLGDREPGALPGHARFGNWLATNLIRMIWGVRYTDLGPFRAITSEALQRLRMQDRNYGWTVEMQLKAAQHHLRIAEVPVSYRRRIGVSKVSGTFVGSVRAGWKILYTIARHVLSRR